VIDVFFMSELDIDVAPEKPIALLHSCAFLMDVFLTSFFDNNFAPSEPILDPNNSREAVSLASSSSPSINTCTNSINSKITFMKGLVHN